ncbi:MAG: hypothetical protein JW825_06975 [Candidatus Methanofastidiosa archaeon]|nr:hypothetical protein [Candidatus Methanofastidiosa archaeon]
MKTYRERSKDLVHKVAVVFFLLWLISVATDVLGRYEYREEYLIASFIMWVLGAFIDGFKDSKGFGKNLSRSFRKAGAALFGIWILVLIFSFLGWLGELWDGKVNYPLALSLISFAVSFTIKASTIKNKNWRIRSTLYSLGLLIILSWILMKVFELFIEYQDATILVGIGVMALGYLIGASSRTHDYDYFEEKIEKMSKVMEEVEDIPTASGDLKVLSHGINVGSDLTAEIKRGAIFVDMAVGGERKGNVFFGEGSYKITTEVFELNKGFMGLCYSTGGLWQKIELGAESANDADMEKLGLEEDDIRELSNIFVQEGENSLKRLRDLKARIKGKKTQIDLPFMKIIEGAEGDYVKIGPIEVADLKDGRSSVRIGDREFSDKGEGPIDSPTKNDYYFKILSTDGTDIIKIKGDIKTLKSKGLEVRIENENIDVSKGDVHLKKDGSKRILQTNDINLSIDQSYSLSSRSKSIFIEIIGNEISYRYKEKSRALDDRDVASGIKKLFEKSFGNIAREAFEGSKVPFNELIIQIIQELE